MRKMLLSVLCLGVFSCSSVDANLLDGIKNKIASVKEKVKNSELAQKVKNSKLAQTVKNSKVGQAVKKAASVQVNKKATQLFNTLKSKVSKLVSTIASKAPSAEIVNRVNTAATAINNELTMIKNQGVQNMPLTSLQSSVENISTSLNDVNEATVGLDVSTSAAVTVVNQLKGIIKQMGVTIDKAKEANQEVINAVNNSIDINLTDEEKNQIIALANSISTSLNSIKTTTNPQTLLYDATNLKNAMAALQTRAKNLNKNNQLYQSMTAAASALDYVVSRRMKMTLDDAVKSLDEMGANFIEGRWGEGTDSAVSTDAQ